MTNRKKNKYQNKNNDFDAQQCITVNLSYYPNASKYSKYAQFESNRQILTNQLTLIDAYCT